MLKDFIRFYVLYGPALTKAWFSFMIDKLSQSQAIVSCRQAIFNIRGGYRSKVYLGRGLATKPFPQEIWRKIFEEHLGMRQWPAISRTCWFFHQIVKDVLLKDVVVQGSRSINAFDMRMPVSFFFARSIENNSELGSFVRSLFLSGSARETDQYFLATRLDLFPNLKTLHLLSFQICPKLLSALRSHPHLNVLDMTYCYFHDSVRNDRSPHSIGSDIKEFTFRYFVDNRPADIWLSIVPRTLEVLELQTNELGLLRMLPQAKIFGETLTRLDISGINYYIIPLLESVPKLKCLRISNYDRAEPEDRELFSLLPVDAIPSLDHYSGPAVYSPWLVLNRPVYSVCLSFGSKDNVANVLTSLDQSSVSITELGLFWNVEIADALPYAPTTIRRLEWGYLDKTKPMTPPPELSLLTSLEVLQVHVYSGNLDDPPHDWQDTDVMRITAVCPSIKQINIDSDRWDLLKENVWSVSRLYRDR